MTQRSGAKQFCVMLCSASALLCAASGAPMLAVVQGVAAIAIGRARFGRPLTSSNVDALLVTLQHSRTTAEASLSMICAVAMPNIVTVPSSGRRWAQTAIAFRDEMTPDRWRQVTTALRHQPRPAAPSTLSTKILHR